MVLLLSSFEGAGSHIPLDIAEGYIKHYMTQAKEKQFGTDSTDEINVAVSYDLDSLNRVLKQDGCKGLRLYFGLESGGNEPSLTVIIIGIDELGNDIGFNPHTLEPLASIESEERGTKTTSTISKVVKTSDRAFLLERILK